MLDQSLDTNYLITYSNYFEVEGKTFAFRKKELFDITTVPKYMDLKNNNNCFGYWINRKWVSLSKIESIIIREPKVVDASDLQWNIQLNLDYVFNLKL